MSNIMANQTPQLLGSICSTCTKHGKKIVVVNSEKNPEKEKQLAQDLIDQRVDGLLVISGYNSEFYQELDCNELPVVLADRVPKNVDMDSVAINHKESTYFSIHICFGRGFCAAFLGFISLLKISASTFFFDLTFRGISCNMEQRQSNI